MMDEVFEAIYKGAVAVIGAIAFTTLLYAAVHTIVGWFL